MRAGWWSSVWKTSGVVLATLAAPAVVGAIPVPEIASDYVLIYQPQSDVYSGLSTENYVSGQVYKTWQPNDHTFVKAPDGRWHCIGITRPDDVMEDGVHEASGFLFHARAPKGGFQEACRPKTWIDQPKIQLRGAPHCMEIDGLFHLINSANDHLVSTDLYNWQEKEKLAIQREKETRDPNVLYWDGTYYLVRCNNRTVNLVTSTDFEHWTEPVDIFTAPEESWQCESPTLLRYKGNFYLFWCLWDRSPDREKLPTLYKGHTPWAYDYRTFVYVSDTPSNFNGREPVALLKAHAPEIIADEDGNYYISSADYPQRGVNVAKLRWRESNDADEN